MLLFALFALLATSVARADNQSETQNQIAIGLPVLDRGISLWLVRPKTMWGLEFHERLAQSMPRRWISRAWGTSKSRATWPSDE